MIRPLLLSLGLVFLLGLACDRPAAGPGAAEGLRPRPFLPQLSILTSYRECPNVAGSDDLLRDPRCPDLMGSAAQPPSWPQPVSIDTVELLHGVDERHRRALGALLGAQNREELTHVLELFEDAASAAQPRSAALLSDLAAAYLVRAQALGQPADLARGLERAAEAIEVDGSFAPARFNAALLCHALGLAHCERNAWKAYRRLDPSSPWAAEAARNLAQRSSALAETTPRVRAQLSGALQHDDAARLGELATSFPATAESWAADELLGTWATAVAGLDELRAEALLGYARELAQKTAAFEHHRPLAAALEAIAAARQDCDPARLAALARGHRAYAEGDQRSRAMAFARAGQRYAEAQRALTQGGSAFADVAKLEQIACWLRDSRFERGLAALDDFAGERGAVTGVVGGRAAWLRAFAETQMRRPLEALDSYAQAAELYASAGDLPSLVSVETRHAEVLRLVDQNEEAWRTRYRALARVGRLEDRKVRAWVLSEASEPSLALGLGRVAQLLQSEAVLEARLAGDELMLAESLRQSARIALANGRSELALAALQEASKVAQGFATSDTYRAVRLRVVELEARLALPSDAALALAKLDEASVLAGRLGQRLYLSDLQATRAEALRALERPREELQALDTAVGLVEEEWAATLSRRSLGEHEAFWPTYFGAGRRYFDRLIHALWSAGDVDRALGVAERSRAREVLDLLGGPSSPELGLDRFFGGRVRPLGVEEIAARLPRNLALIEYVLTDERLLAWVLDQRGIRFFGEMPAGDSLAARVETAIQAIRFDTRQDEVEGHLALLWDRLLAPLAPYLRPQERLVFVPDEVLHAVPFAALYDRASHRYLIESHPVAVAPSATLYAYSLQRDRALAAPSIASALVVCDPAFAQERLPLVDRLPGAAAQCQQIAGLYPRSLELGDKTATKRHFLSELGRYSVLHFSGHAFGHPSAAYLLLAPDDGDPSGTLYAHELLRRGVGITRLAVLSACNTAAEQGRLGQGVAALVRPLIGAGIPAVIGTLWPVDDGAAAYWSQAFHRRLLGGDDAAEALQAAQIELLRGRRLKLQMPRSWAAFELVGHASLHRRRKEGS